MGWTCADSCSQPRTREPSAAVPLASDSLLSTVMVNMEWDREESLFIAVAAVCLFLRPTCSRCEHHHRLSSSGFESGFMHCVRAGPAERWGGGDAEHAGWQVHMHGTAPKAKYRGEVGAVGREYATSCQTCRRHRMSAALRTTKVDSPLMYLSLPASLSAKAAHSNISDVSQQVIGKLIGEGPVLSSRTLCAPPYELYLTNRVPSCVLVTICFILRQQLL